MKTFASDNFASVHPDVMAAIQAANGGHAMAYGGDGVTARAQERFRDLFGPHTETFFVWSGTGANIVALASILKPFEAVICPATAHINVDECGASERMIGCKLITLPTTNGKITPDDILPCLHAVGNEHHAQPKVISITQSTEYGTLYRVEEIRALATIAHEHGMYLHVDGARIANAAAALGISLKELVTDTGVDVLSFGGTKNGMMGGDAVVYLNAELARDAKYLRKQMTQLPSKMRYISAQFEALLSNDLWLRNATHANAMAKKLADAVREIPGVELTQNVEVNAVFARIPKEKIVPLQMEMFFWPWNEETGEVRWMTAWDTTQEDIDHFVDLLRKHLA
jgi:threonine aldolase